jgi:sugar lactone lactonase YvrE
MDQIQRANLDGTGIEGLVPSGLGFSSGIAVDVSGGKMYWTSESTVKIQRANLNGTGAEDLVTSGLSSPEGIALDVARGRMYWTDTGTNKIQRANLSGTGVEDLVTSGLNHPSGIALDAAIGKMYWTDAGTGKIQRANLDGTGVEDLLNTGLDFESGIALDTASGKMYWPASDKIHRANLDGSSVEDLVTFELDSFGTKIALDVAGGKMYWVPSTRNAGPRKIERANLNGTSVEDVVTTISPIAIALDVDLPPASIDVSPFSLDFVWHDIAAGPSAGMAVTITNMGPGNLNFVGSQVALAGTDPGEFTILSDTGQNPLGPGASRTVTAAFDPSSTGVKTADLVITSNDSVTPTVIVPLSGEGLVVSRIRNWDLYE